LQREKHEAQQREAAMETLAHVQQQQIRAGLEEESVRALFNEER